MAHSLTNSRSRSGTISVLEDRTRNYAGTNTAGPTDDRDYAKWHEKRAKHRSARDFEELFRIDRTPLRGTLAFRESSTLRELDCKFSTSNVLELELAGHHPRCTLRE